MIICNKPIFFVTNPSPFYRSFVSPYGPSWGNLISPLKPMDRNLRNGASKSTVYVIKHVNFQLLRAYSAGVNCSNLLQIYIYKRVPLFIHQKMFLQSNVVRRKKWLTNYFLYRRRFLTNLLKFAPFPVHTG